MTTKLFEDLRDFIKLKNPYFQNGYANAYKDTLTDGIYCRTEKGLESIFPADNKGNFFYLRSEPNATFSSKTGISDCGIGRFNFDDRLNVYLVAIVRDADSYALIANLRNTALLFAKANVLPSSAMWQRENVVINEMQGFSEESIGNTLQRLKKETIVRLTLQVNTEFIPKNCLIDPCKC